MMSVFRFCIPLLLVAGVASAQTAIRKTGPKTQSTTSTELVMRLVDKVKKDPNVKQLGADQVGLLSRVVFYQDRQYPNVYYYTPPLALGLESANAYSENLDSVAYDAIRSVHKIVQSSLDTATPEGRAAAVSLFGINSNSHQPNPVALLPRIVEDNSPISNRNIEQTFGSLLNSADEQAQSRFIQAVKLAAASVGWPISGTIKDQNTALQVYASMISGAPVFSVTVPIAFGFDKKTLEAFSVLRNGLPEITFYEMNMDPIWRLRRNPYVSDRSPSAPTPDADVFLANLKVDTNLVLGLENMGISASGGNLELVMTYPGAIRFGYGQNDRPDDVLAEDSRQNLSYNLPGFLIQERALNIVFKGKATCQFKGEVLLKRKVELKKAGGVIVNINVLDKSSDSGNEPEINDCVISDENDNPADTSDPVIQKLVETYKAKHIAKKLAVYQAALTTKEDMLEKALTDEKALESLPMPKEWKLVQTREKIRTCIKKERQGSCLQHSKGGWGRRRMCVEFEKIPFNECNDVYTWIDSFAYQPVAVATFTSEADFSRVFNTTEIFQINLTETLPVFPMTANNNVCIARTKNTSAAGAVSFARTACSAIDANGAGLDKGGDKPTPPTKPVLGGGGDSSGV